MRILKRILQVLAVILLIVSLTLVIAAATGNLGSLLWSVGTWAGIVFDQPGDYIPGTLEHDGLERSYHYYLPTGYDHSEPVPLVIDFHGGGINNLIYLWISRFDKVAEEEGFILVVPNGTGSRYRYSYMREGIDDVGFVSALIDEMEGRYNIDPGRIYAAGYSNGGGMATLLAFELPDRIAAVAPVSSLTTRSVLTEQVMAGNTLPRPITMIISAGTDDQAYIDYPEDTSAYEKWGDELLSIYDVIDFFVDANEVPSEPELIGEWPATEDDPTVITCYRFGNGIDDTEVIFYRVEGGGHSLPGGPKLPGQGATSGHLHHARAVYEHLKNHRLPDDPGT